MMLDTKNNPSPCVTCQDWGACDGFSDCAMCKRWGEWYASLQAKKEDKNNEQSHRNGATSN